MTKSTITLSGMQLQWRPMLRFCDHGDELSSIMDNFFNRQLL
jgi:hypothetical protein